MAKIQYGSFIDGLIRDLEMDSAVEDNVKSRSDTSWLDSYEPTGVDYSWRANHYYDYADIDPDEYETEKEYLRAVENRYGWQEFNGEGEESEEDYQLDEDY